jgi:anti-sigma factor RsiW
MIDSWTERLSEYLDGELAPEERTLCEGHVATCASCKEALDGLRAVVMQARALPEIAPAEDLWPGVAARIAAFAQEEAPAHAVRAGSGTVRSSRGSAGRFSFTWPQLAAAGLALVALSAAGSWYAAGKLGRGTTDPFGNVVAGSGSYSPPTGSNDPARSSQGSNATQAAAGDADRRYEQTVAELRRALDQNRNDLDPQTVATIESNIRIIDLATEQARQALADDPGNAYLKEHLSKTMQRKVELLREATMLASTGQ